MTIFVSIQQFVYKTAQSVILVFGFPVVHVHLTALINHTEHQMEHVKNAHQIAFNVTIPIHVVYVYLHMN
jgi:hypothetical protein